jgi:DNA-binding transcriptional LysR family regulator
MELKWLDDYLALIETGTFSAAAEKRRVSQPAFSRRIQLLEEWLGVVLIDRSRKPLRFTPLASQHEAAFRSLATHIYEFQATLKSDATNSPSLVLASQHSLAAAYLPTFLEELRALMPEQRFRIRSENRDEGVGLLMRGHADILLTYESPQTVSGVPSQLATSCTLGNDALVLVASATLCDSADFLPELMRDRLVAVQYVSEFSLGLREMALIHQGAAWLPRTLIAQDLKAGTLRELSSVGRPVPLIIMAYFASRGGQALQDLLTQFMVARMKESGIPGSSIA